MTLVQAAGGVSRRFTDANGTPIANGQAIPLLLVGCGGTGATSATVTYTANAVTLTGTPPATATWTGSGPDDNWSTAANWTPGAPSAAGRSDLLFPAGVCATRSPTTIDDIPGLAAGAVALANVVASTSGGQPGGGSQPKAYSVSGDSPLTLDGGLTVRDTYTGSGNTFFSAPLQFGVPITLGAANNWSLDQWTDLELPDTIAGAPSLHVAATDDDVIDLAGSVETGPLTVAGTGDIGPAVLMDAPAGGEINGSDGQPVSFQDATLLGAGTVGPLSLSASGLYVGSPDGGGRLQVNGSLTLDYYSGVEWDFPFGDGTAPQLDVSGSADLGSAELILGEGCVPVGQTYTLLQATGAIDGTFTDANGDEIVDGEILPPTPDGCSSTSSGPPLQIAYLPHAVTVTAVAAGTTTTTTSTTTYATTTYTSTTFTSIVSATTSGRPTVTATTTAGTAPTIPTRTTTTYPPPPLTITSPATGSTTSLSSVSVSGTTTPADVLTLIVDGQLTAVAPDGSWSASVPLKPGPNTITATATGLGGVVRTRQITLSYVPIAVALKGTPASRGAAVTVALACTAAPGATCRVSAALTSTERVRGTTVLGVTAAVRPRQVGVGGGSATLGPAKTTRVTIQLNATGRRLLARFGKLPVRVTISLNAAAGHATTVATRTLTVR